MDNQSIKQVVVSLSSDDSEDYPQMQVKYKGKATKVLRLSPYGLIANPKTGSLGVSFSSGGQEAVKFVVAMQTLDRLKNLKEGEVGLYNEITGALVLNGVSGIDIIAPDAVNITAPEVTINGVTVINGTLTVNGTITSTGLVSAPAVTTVGAVTCSSLIVPGSPNYEVHTHTQGNDSDGDTQVPTGGPV